jgi:FemAB-related protein (PEP-CTERM system-associated)
MNQGEVSDVQVKSLDEASAARWDTFVDACSEATFFHRAGWKRVIERSFHHPCHFLYAETGGSIKGVLPLVHVKSRLFGNALISNAFCVYGGPAATHEAAFRALDARALELAHALQVDYVEYRGRTRAHPDWACNDTLYATFRKELDPDPDRNLHAIPRKQRAMVRKGMKFGLRIESESRVDRFYRLYAESARNLGTPVFSKRYFEELMQVFADSCEVSTVVHHGRPVAGVLSFYIRDEVLPYYAGSTADARTMAANDFMYWELMRRACERGYRVFDFGRSKVGTGGFSFKKHWGFHPRALVYEYKLLRGDEVPAVNPLNPKYRYFIAVWKRLPLPVANVIGPRVARNLG